MAALNPDVRASQIARTIAIDNLRGALGGFMKRFFQFGLPLLLALIVVGTLTLVSAQGGKFRPGKVDAVPPIFRTPAVPPPAAVKHFPQGVYLSTGNGVGTAIAAATFTPVDAAVTVSCPGPSGTCTILANQFVETSGSAVGNNAALCFYIDGVSVPNACYFTNEIPSDGTFDQSATQSWGSGVSVGTHTAQTVLYCSGGCNLYDYNLQYTVYKP
jgi:hypothetical protein